MLYSILAAVASYYGFLFVIGIFVNTIAIQETLIAFAVLCFILGYFARSSKFIHRMANWLGGIAAVFAAVSLFILPILQGTGNTWVIILAVLAGTATYVVSRRYWHRRFLRRNRNTGYRSAPPFGQEWCRWLFAFVL